MSKEDEIRRTEFGRRLQKALNDKGWTQSELARRIASKLPTFRIGRDNVSKWVRGKVLPLPPALEAICKVLEMETRDLLPERATPIPEPDEMRLQAALAEANRQIVVYREDIANYRKDIAGLRDLITALIQRSGRRAALQGTAA